jgi:AraC-like DNA-binding protein
MGGKAGGGRPRAFPVVNESVLPIPSAHDGSVALNRLRWTDPCPHRHRELELNLVVSGRAHYLCGGRRYELRRGDVAWLFAAQPHILLDQSDDFALWVAVFRPRLVRALCAGEAAVLAESDPAGEFCRRLAAADAARLGELFSEIERAAAEPRRHNAGLAWLLLNAWRLFRDAAPVPPGPEAHPAVALALRRLAADPGVSLGALAREVGLSPGRLGRVFKGATGRSVAAARARARVEAVVARLRAEPHCSLLRAALAAGFGSYTQFHRVFTEVMGRSPRQWRGEQER